MFIVNRVFSYFWMPFYLMSLLTFGSFLLVLPCSFPWLTLKTGEVFFIMFIAGHSEDQRICSTGRHICIVFVFGFCLFCSSLQHTYIYIYKMKDMVVCSMGVNRVGQSHIDFVGERI